MFTKIKNWYLITMLKIGVAIFCSLYNSLVCAYIPKHYVSVITSASITAKIDHTVPLSLNYLGSHYILKRSNAFKLLKSINTSNNKHQN